VNFGGSALRISRLMKHTQGADQRLQNKEG
jgi:hypothetical protein